MSLLQECIASHQAINSKTGCYLIPIFQRRSDAPAKLKHDDSIDEVYGGFHKIINPDSFWKPFASPINCGHDGNEFIKVSMGVQTARRLYHFISALYAEALVTEKGENSYYDKPFDVQSFVRKNAPQVLAYVEKASATDLDLAQPGVFSEMQAILRYVEDGVDENRVFVNDYFGIPRQLAFAFISKTSRDELIKITATEQAHGMFPSMSQLDVFETAYRHLEDESVNASDPGSYRFAATQFLQAYRPIGGYLPNGYPGEAEEVKKAVIDHLVNPRSKTVLLHQIQPWLDDRYMYSAMQTLNIKILPSAKVHRGDANEVGLRYAQFIVAISQQTIVD